MYFSMSTGCWSWDTLIPPWRYQWTVEDVKDATRPIARIFWEKMLLKSRDRVKDPNCSLKLTVFAFLHQLESC